MQKDVGRKKHSLGHNECFKNPYKLRYLLSRLATDVCYYENVSFFLFLSRICFYTSVGHIENNQWQLVLSVHNTVSYILQYKLLFE